MTANELLLKRVIQDAIEMLRWQSKKPLSADSWGQWVNDALTALDDIEHSAESTKVFTSPFTYAQLKKAASKQGIQP